MKDKILILWAKYKHLIAYAFWGVVTTVINIGVFQFLSSGVHMNYQVANVIAWFLSVLVAFSPTKYGSLNRTTRPSKPLRLNFLSFISTEH